MTNHAKYALAHGWERYTVDMTRVPVYAATQPAVCKSTTQNCFVSGELICWGDVLGKLEYDAYDNATIINTPKARYEISDMEYGHAKLRRTSSAVDRFERVAHGGPMSKWNSNVEEAQYHYFNPNGAYVAHRACMETLTQYVDSGHINSGWLIAHDAQWEKGHLEHAAMLRRSPSVRYYIERILDEVNDTYTRIAQVHLGERDRAGKSIGENK